MNPGAGGAGDYAEQRRPKRAGVEGVDVARGGEIDVDDGREGAARSQRWRYAC